MFWKKKDSEKPGIPITNDNYTRWLQAGRPPFWWFMGLEEPTQQGLADLGTAHVLDSSLMQDESAGTQDRDDEASKAKALAEELIAGIAGGKRPDPATMSGLGKKQAEQKNSQGMSRSMFGRPPDEADG
jgi:hypothetical protein